MRFEHLLSRADDETLQALIGQRTVRLLGRLDATLTTPSSLRRLVLSSRPVPSLLLSNDSRPLLMELLRADEAHQLATLLGIDTSGDVYGALKQVRYAHGSERERQLFLFFETYPPDVEAPNNEPPIVPCESSYALFPHQRRAVRRVSALLRQPPHRALLHMPTGSGKTRSAMSLIADHLRQREPGLVIWLAYSEELCDQACDEFQAAWNRVGDREVNVFRFWGNHSFDVREARDGLIVAGLPKIHRAAMKDLQVISKLGAAASLLVIDEAHQAIAPTYKLILEALFSLNASGGLLGLTATPGRTWSDIAADEELAAFFAHNKVMLEVEGYENPVEYLTDAGYLARVDYRPLLYSGGNRWSSEDADRIASEFDIPPRILALLGEDEQRNLHIVHQAEILCQRHKRILVFAASVPHSDLIASVLQARGHDARSVTGATSGSERARIIADFKQKDDLTKVICNYGVLTTGFDAPQTSAVLIARPTKSLVLYSQMIGRAIRGMLAGGNEAAEVVTVVDQDLPGFGSVADAFTNWEDVWKR